MPLVPYGDAADFTLSLVNWEDATTHCLIIVRCHILVRARAHSVPEHSPICSYSPSGSIPTPAGTQAHRNLSDIRGLSDPFVILDCCTVVSDTKACVSEVNHHFDRLGVPIQRVVDRYGRTFVRTLAPWTSMTARLTFLDGGAQIRDDGRSGDHVPRLLLHSLHAGSLRVSKLHLECARAPATRSDGRL